MELINDIKEIFGLYPVSSSSSHITGKAGEASSFAFTGAGGYLPPKSVPDNDNSAEDFDLTTQTFRIFVLPTTTSNPSSPQSVSSLTPADPNISLTTSTVLPTTPFRSTFTSSSQKTRIKQEMMAKGMTSTTSSPTPYAYIREPSPGFKIDLVWSTLVPPSLTNVENEVATNENTKLTNSKENGGTVPLNNGLYLPPNKEYLPPSQ